MSIEMNVSNIVEVNGILIDKTIDNGLSLRMPTLPGKYSKFETFGYWLFKLQRDSGILSEDDFQKSCELIHIFSLDVNSKIRLYEDYFIKSNDISKDIQLQNKDMFKKKKKDSKNKNPLEKKPKNTKNNDIISNSNNDIISQIVMRANSIDGIIPQIVEQCVQESVQEPVEKKKRIRKVKDVPKVNEDKVDNMNEDKVDNMNEDKVDNVIEKKKRVRKVKDNSENKKELDVEKKKRVRKVKESKEKDNIENEVKNADMEEKNDIITLNTVSIDDVEYFYDSENNLYNSNHDIIGLFNPDTLSVTIS
jgi:hypothetical protein